MLKIQDHLNFNQNPYPVEKENNIKIHSLSKDGFKDYLANLSLVNKFIEKNKKIKDNNNTKIPYENETIDSTKYNIKNNFKNQLNEDKLIFRLTDRYNANKENKKFNYSMPKLIKSEGEIIKEKNQSIIKLKI